MSENQTLPEKEKTSSELLTESIKRLKDEIAETQAKIQQYKDDLKERGKKLKQLEKAAQVVSAIKNA